MAKKNINFDKLKPQTCVECGRRIRNRQSNVCRECLEKVMRDFEKKGE